jgi:hypothetical protein
VLLDGQPQPSVERELVRKFKKMREGSQRRQGRNEQIDPTKSVHGATMGRANASAEYRSVGTEGADQAFTSRIDP